MKYEVQIIHKACETYVIEAESPEAAEEAATERYQNGEDGIATCSWDSLENIHCSPLEP